MIHDILAVPLRSRHHIWARTQSRDWSYQEFFRYHLTGGRGYRPNR